MREIKGHEIMERTKRNEGTMKGIAN